VRTEYVAVPVAQAIREDGVAAAIQKKHVASVLYTYRCTLACRHCLFSCSPRKPNVHVGLEDGLEYLRRLHQTDRVVHIAGGEAMMYWSALIDLCREAGREGVAPHFVETNATWCISDALAYRRLEQLRDAGVLGLLISACPHHQHECPAENYDRCFRAAVEVFGDRNVAAARLTMDELRDFEAIARDEERLADYVRANPPCLVGRAGEALARYLPDRPISELAHDSTWKGPEDHMACRTQFDPATIWEIHVDPYGNVTTCCGIIIGNARRAPLAGLLSGEGWLANPLVNVAYHEGPTGLLSMAVERGYVPRDGYPQKCGLCWEVRKFLRPHFPDILGPDEVYTVD